MTISNQACTVTDTGNGSNTSFAYTFLIPYQSDGVTPAVSVFKTISGVKTNLTLNVDYSISGVGNPSGGTVTFPLSGSPLVAGGTITITRAEQYVQPYAFPNEGFLPQDVEKALDWLVMQVQQLNQRVTALGG